MAGNTPFKKWKRETHLGGVRDPLIVHWPKGIKAKGEVRTQYAHAIDLVPTVLEVCGVEPPDGDQGRDAEPDRGGRASRHTFNDPKAKSRHDDAVLRDVRLPGDLPRRLDGRLAAPPFGTPLTEALLEGKTWELYHTDVDFSQAHDLAARAPRPGQGDGRALVGRGGQVPRPAARRPRPAAARRPPPAAHARRVQVRVRPRDAKSVPPDGGRPGDRPLAPDHGRGRDPPAGAEGVLLAQGSGSAATRSTSRTGKPPLHLQLRRARDRPRSRRPTPSPPASRPSGWSSPGTVPTGGLWRCSSTTRKPARERSPA